MLLTVSVELPALEIVKVRCAEKPTPTLPKARLPLSEIIRLGGTFVPVPEMAIVLMPEVLSETTVTAPVKTEAEPGVNVTVTLWTAPAAMVPENAPLNPVGYTMLL